MKAVLAILALFSATAFAAIPTDKNVACGDFQAKVARNGWANMYVNGATKHHPTVFVKSSEYCFDSSQEAYRVRVPVGDTDRCWLNSCFDDAFTAGEWERRINN
jgi:hypothetical protein